VRPWHQNKSKIIARPQAKTAEPRIPVEGRLPYCHEYRDSLLRYNRQLKKNFSSKTSCENPNDFDGQSFKTRLFQQLGYKPLSAWLE
jgi:hypothetical protein